MNNIPKITIIIPVYNRVALLPYTLNSIIEHTFTDWECILVDDCSTDESLMVLLEYQKKDCRFKVFLRPLSLKKGANSCRNYGFLQATGSYIKWFDSDYIMLQKHLEISYETIIKNELDFVASDTLNFNNKNGLIVKFKDNHSMANYIMKLFNKEIEFNNKNISEELINEYGEKPFTDRIEVIYNDLLYPKRLN